MPNLTAKELSAIEDQLTGEHLLVKKFQSFAAQSCDPQIKSKCEQIAAVHQKHYDRILSHLK